jgi:DNA primase
MAIPRATIDRIRQLADVVEVVGQTVQLKRTGNHFTGLCPFHQEKTPSFKVFPDSQNFHCFGCDEGGTVFDFVMRTEGLTFPEAVRLLARQVGVEVEGVGPEDTARERETDAVHETLALAARYYASRINQDEGRRAREYFLGRGLSPATLESWQLGYAPDGWDGLLSALAKWRTPEDLIAAGLAIPSKKGGRPYDRFRDRVLFPIHDASGRVVGFGGRLLGEGEPKYLNTPETAVYHKSRVLYGLREARTPMRQEGTAVVVEGYMDVLALHQAGIGQAVATCGTSLTPDHARILKRYAEEVVLVFDGDTAGLKAALRAFETVLPTGLRVRAAILPGGKDPDDVVRAEGADAMRRMIAGADDLVAFFWRQSKGDPKPQAIDRLSRLVALSPEIIDRREYAARAADLFKFDEATFVSVAEKLARGRTTPAASAALHLRGGEPEGFEADLLRATVHDLAFWGEIEALLDHPELRRTVEDRIRPDARRLLTEAAAGSTPVPPAAMAERAHDPALKGFLLRLAAEEVPEPDRLRRLQRDVGTRIPRLALEAERDRVRRALGEAVRSGDGDREAKLFERLEGVTRRLQELGRDESSFASGKG